MLGHRANFYANAAILYLLIAQFEVAVAQSEAVVVAKARQEAKVERVVESDEICSEDQNRYRLTISGLQSSGELRFRLENLGDAPIFAHLMRDGARFSTDYPTVEVLFKSEEGGGWRAPVMNPVAVDSSGPERVLIEPGTSIDLSTPVSEYLPRTATMVKLQLRFGTSPEVAASACTCVASTPFVVPQRYRDESPQVSWTPTESPRVSWASTGL